jgi:hypothetical protein
MLHGGATYRLRLWVVLHSPRDRLHAATPHQGPIINNKNIAVS